MYKRDFGILLLSVCALYLSLQHEGAYQFKKAWYHSFNKHKAGVHELQEHTQPVPPPLVADLNGDGKPEVITATPDGRIQLLAPRHFGDGFAKAQLISQTDLGLATTAGGAKMRIAAVASGYLTPPPKELVRSPRKQVVVVVTTGLQVICLNHNLHKEWEHNLAPYFVEHGGIRELAVHISDQVVTKSRKGQAEDHGDKGLVVVGASVVPLTIAQREELEGKVEEGAREELLVRFRARGRKGGASDQERAELQQEGRHFSYFAFEGGTGTLRWKHEAKDFHRNMGELADSLESHHAYHMRAEESETRHYGESSCRDYRVSVLAALPHSWHSPQDTSLVPAHFVKHKAGAGSQKQELAKMGTLKSRQQTAAVAKGGTMGKVVSAVVQGATKGEGPATARRHKAALPPNVVVAHLEEGIEAIHLFSGRTVCRLHLPTPGLHVDLNGDGVPEHVVAVGVGPGEPQERGDAFAGHAHERLCYVSVHSGIPARRNLFNGTVCHPLWRRMHAGTQLPVIEVAPPIFLMIPGKHGHYREGLLQKGSIAILNSQGELTSYDSWGHLLWQHFVGVTWKASENEDAPGPTPTLKAMPLRPGAVPSAILAAGDASATVVSEHGTEVDTWDLPDTPAMPLQLVDWNFDGYTDILLVTQDGIWAWAQVRHPGALPYSALLGALMVIMAALFITQQGFMRPSGTDSAAKRRALRSTERED